MAQDGVAHVVYCRYGLGLFVQREATPDTSVGADSSESLHPVIDAF